MPQIRDLPDLAAPGSPVEPPTPIVPGLLSRAVKMGWAVGEFAIAAHMAVISIYFLFYLVEYQHIPAYAAGLLIFLPRLWNIILDPLIGTVSDRIVSRWGRRRPFVLAGAVVWGGAFVAMFWPAPSMALGEKIVWFGVTAMLVNTGLSLYHVPYSAMAAEMTRRSNERLELVSYKEIVARLSVLLTVMASPLVISAAPSKIEGYHWMGELVGAAIVLSGAVSVFATRHVPNNRPQLNRLGVAEQLRAIRRNKPFLLLNSASFLVAISDAFYSALFVYFVTRSLHFDAAVTGITYPIGSLAAVITTALWARLGARIGKSTAFTLALIGLAACFCLSLLLPLGPRWDVFPFMALFGAINGGVFVLPSGLLPDTVDYDEKSSGARREGAIYGVSTFTAQTGMALGTSLVSFYLGLVGPAQPSADHTQVAISLGYALGPVAFLLSAAALMAWYRAFEQSSPPPS